MFIIDIILTITFIVLNIYVVWNLNKRVGILEENYYKLKDEVTFQEMRLDRLSEIVFPKCKKK